MREPSDELLLLIESLYRITGIRYNEAHNMGRPPKFSSPEDLQEKIDGYLKECEKKKNYPTKGGLALYLDTTRDLLSDYEKKEEYSDTIKGIYQVIEDTWVQGLQKKNSVAGIIFYLKNAFGKDYRDKQELDHTSKGESILGINYIKPRGDNDKAE